MGQIIQKVVRRGIIGVVVLLCSNFIYPSWTYAATESIKNFQSHIDIRQDGTIEVTENITYDFGSNKKHGIFRDIPLTSNNGPQINIQIIGVTDQRGEHYPYTTSVADNILHIRVGDPEVLISGVKTYNISYYVSNVIQTFSDHDELYWNVTGNQWPVVIENASAVVTLPDSLTSNVRMNCFVGAQGSQDKDCVYSQNGTTVNYAATKILNSGEGLTLVLGLPSGFIQNTYIPTLTSSSQQTDMTSEPATTDTNRLPLWLFVILAPFFLIILFPFLFVKMVRTASSRIKPKPVIPRQLKKQPVTIEYNPPDDLSPIEVGTILNRRVDPTDISSVIMDLAVRGYLKIKYSVKPIKFLPDKKDFELIKLKNGFVLTNPADRAIFRLLFTGRNSVKLSDLKKENTDLSLTIKEIEKAIKKSIQKKGYFKKDSKNKTKWVNIIIFSLFLVVLCWGFFRGGISVFIACIVLICIVLLIQIIMNSNGDILTPQGLVVLGKILGFKEFLQLTEKDKLRLLDAPELQPETFEKFLPYAIALGVEDKWAQKFATIYNTIPGWYEDPTITIFNSNVLVNNLKLFNNTLNFAFNINAVGTNGGGGFSGGGGSGGGSGGGGGGSW